MLLPRNTAHRHAPLHLRLPGRSDSTTFGDWLPHADTEDSAGPGQARGSLAVIASGYRPDRGVDLHRTVFHYVADSNDVIDAADRQRPLTLSGEAGRTQPGK